MQAQEQTIISSEKLPQIQRSSDEEECDFQNWMTALGLTPGLGEFGQFFAKAFKRQGHNVLGTSRSDYSEYCQEHGIEFYRSILSTEDVVRKIPFHKPKPNTILADVLSVKEYARNLLLDVVPEGFGILLCTHPMLINSVEKIAGRDCGLSTTKYEYLRIAYKNESASNF
ncbi:hypothetical protein IFM89_007680 [Coptis chinensis]|uniref:Arogenate dehydrogenase n=1 Tax=Coptis chinensis TaxID=261450 RepID=A0A835HSG3_9MAGN|nr:hypothetical protein IFM89_007680 [Coptis chinensis]